MRRFALSSLFVALVMAAATPSASAASTSLNAHFREEGGISSAPSGTGFIRGYGKATEAFTETSVTWLDSGCLTRGGVQGVTFIATGTTLMTLVSDGSTLTISETDVGCTPGNSHEGTPGWTPTRVTGSFEIDTGTGVFTGAGGGGTMTGKFAGNGLENQSVFIFDYEGTLTL